MRNVRTAILAAGGTKKPGGGGVDSREWPGPKCGISFFLIPFFRRPAAGGGGGGQSSPPSGWGSDSGFGADDLSVDEIPF